LLRILIIEFKSEVDVGADGSIDWFFGSEPSC